MSTFVAGLLNAAAKLAGDIEGTHDELRKMFLDLENIDVTIVQFGSDFKVERATGMPNRCF